jgi:hypothetical protein
MDFMTTAEEEYENLQQKGIILPLLPPLEYNKGQPATDQWQDILHTNNSRLNFKEHDVFHMKRGAFLKNMEILIDKFTLPDLEEEYLNAAI